MPKTNWKAIARAVLKCCIAIPWQVFSEPQFDLAAGRGSMQASLAGILRANDHQLWEAVCERLGHHWAPFPESRPILCQPEVLPMFQLSPETNAL